MERQSKPQSSGHTTARAESDIGDRARSTESVPAAAEKVAEGDSPVASGQDAEKEKQLAENLEKLVALNLNNSGLGGPRFSRPLLQLASALAGLISLFLMYCCTRLMF